MFPSDLGRLTWRVIVGAVLIVVGVILLTGRGL
jgi:drug/metabolite transporter (DMT)-like permease